MCVCVCSVSCDAIGDNVLLKRQQKSRIETIVGKCILWRRWWHKMCAFIRATTKDTLCRTVCVVSWQPCVLVTPRVHHVHVQRIFISLFFHFTSFRRWNAIETKFAWHRHRRPDKNNSGYNDKMNEHRTTSKQYKPPDLRCNLKENFKLQITHITTEQQKKIIK